ncbi:hypothetical protein AAMO2058_001455000 [Amorphochlora amoebiformis]
MLQVPRHILGWLTNFASAGLENNPGSFGEDEKLKVVTEGFKILEDDARKAVKRKFTYSEWIRDFSPWDVEVPTTTYPTGRLSRRADKRSSVLAKVWVKVGGTFNAEEIEQFDSLHDEENMESKELNKQPLTYKEKQMLKVGILKLEPHQLRDIVAIIAREAEENDEIEIDLDKLDTPTLRELMNYINKSQRKSKNKSQAKPQNKPQNKFPTEGKSESPRRAATRPEPKESFRQMLQSFISDPQVLSGLQRSVPMAMKQLLKGKSPRAIALRIAGEIPAIRNHPFGLCFVPIFAFLGAQLDCWASLLCAQAAQANRGVFEQVARRAAETEEKKARDVEIAGEKAKESEVEEKNTKEREIEEKNTKEREADAAAVAEAQSAANSEPSSDLEYDLVNEEEILKSMDEDEEKEHAALKKKIRDWMQKDLENSIIKFKRKNPDGSFVEFARKVFPENCRVNPSNDSLEVSGRLSEVEALFLVTTAKSKLHTLGPLPV